VCGGTAGHELIRRWADDLAARPRDERGMSHCIVLQRTALPGTTSRSVGGLRSHMPLSGHKRATNEGIPQDREANQSP
jgi:hypothetical protein